MNIDLTPSLAAFSPSRFPCLVDVSVLPPMLRPEDLQVFFGMSRRVAWAFAYSKGIRLGNEVRIPRPNIERWLQSGEGSLTLSPEPEEDIALEVESTPNLDDNATPPSVSRWTMGAANRWREEGKVTRFLIRYFKRERGPSIRCETEVCTPAGRIDLILGGCIIECKASLGMGTISHALGQLWLYTTYFPTLRPVIAGTEESAIPDVLVQRILACGVSLWILRLREKGR